MSKQRNHSLLYPLLVTVVFLLAMLSPGVWQDLLEYQRMTMEKGELWRLITGHLVHLGWGHLLMNLLGFWLIQQLFFRNDVPILTCISGLILLTLGTSAGLYLFSTSVEWYRGFSGVLHGLLIWGLLRELRPPIATNLFLLSLVIFKLAWEQFSGPVPGSETIAKGRVIVDAHLYGGLTGTLLWLLENRISKFTRELVE